MTFGWAAGAEPVVRDAALRADRVLVMDGGPPLLGSHAELMAGSPTYADLMAA